MYTEVAAFKSERRGIGEGKVFATKEEAAKDTLWWKLENMTYLGMNDNFTAEAAFQLVTEYNDEMLKWCKEYKEAVCDKNN